MSGKEKKMKETNTIYTKENNIIATSKTKRTETKSNMDHTYVRRKHMKMIKGKKKIK